MKILVINSGSSSIKFQLINMTTSEVLIIGIVERIGIDNSRLKYTYQGEKKVVNQSVRDHSEGIQMIVDHITKKEKVIENKEDIFAIGHRVVHAGEKYNGTVPITDDVIQALNDCIPLAPPPQSGQYYRD